MSGALIYQVVMTIMLYPFFFFVRLLPRMLILPYCLYLRITSCPMRPVSSHCFLKRFIDWDCRRPRPISKHTSKQAAVTMNLRDWTHKTPKIATMTGAMGRWMPPERYRPFRRNSIPFCRVRFPCFIPV